jgi:hypothetical protein
LIPPLRSLAKVEVIGIANFPERSDQIARAKPGLEELVLRRSGGRAVINLLLTKKHGIAFVFQRHRQLQNDIAPVSCRMVKAWGGRS